MRAREAASVAHACFAGSASGARLTAADLELHDCDGPDCGCLHVDVKEWMTLVLQHFGVISTVEQLALDLYAVVES